MYEPVETTTTCALDEPDAAEEEDAAALEGLDAAGGGEAGGRGGLPENEPLPVEPVDPELLVPDEPAPDAAEVGDAVTCWPTVRFIEATVPAMVDSRVAPSNDVCAVVTCVCAEAILASSRAIWLAVALSA